ncbi:MAG: hypothetical protein GF398_17935 [Chitinivibrionales bacterium]|nr:hypothetical protein [Chitinivibrionales bacterium]
MNRFLIAASTGVVLLQSVCFSQPQVTTLTTDWELACTGERVDFTETTVFGTTGETITVDILGHSKTFTSWTDYEMGREDFIHQVRDIEEAKCAGAGGVINPIGTQNQVIFTNAVFSTRASPRAAQIPGGAAKRQTTTAPSKSVQQAPPQQPDQPPEEDNSGKAVQLEVSPDEDKPARSFVLSRNNISTDLEYDLFKHTGRTGNNFLLRAGYTRTSDDGVYNYGGNLIFNTLLMLDETFFNNAINLFGTKTLKETGELQRKGGLTVNMLIVDKDFGDNRIGASVSGHFVDRRYLKNDHILVYGAMMQESFVGRLITTLLSVGGMYGLPLGERLALNFDGLYTINALAFGEKGYIKLTNPHMLSIAGSLDIFITELFSFTTGMKTTLLVKNYNDFIVTIGASRRF